MADDGSTIREALEQFQESESGSDYNRRDFYDDIMFARMSEQWPKEVKEIRRQEGRPCLTVNKLAPLVRQVVNESRQNKPAIEISPVDNGADINTAEVISGLVRSIERHSDADIAYDTAIDHAVSGGFGFFRIDIDYAHDESFDLEARIRRIPNALMVHWDINSTAGDASDWNYAFVSDFLTKEQFKRQYPDAQPVNFEGDDRDYINYWMQEEQIRIAEYFTRTEGKRKLFQLSNGAVFREDMLPMAARRFFETGGIDLGPADDDEVISAYLAATGLAVQNQREATFFEVKRRMISGVEVLEEEDWPGSMIPICPVWGDEVMADGRRYFRSMIRDAKDAQMMHNFWRSATTELVALAPRAPFLIEDNAIPPGEEEKWATANTRSHPYLKYAQGRNMPQRQPFASTPTGALQEAISANEDMQAITGIYPSSIGERSNETSGRAILARERQANVSNFHFIDNLSRAIRYAGRVLVEIIPAVYSTRQTIRILGQDESEKVVRLTPRRRSSSVFFVHTLRR